MLTYGETMSAGDGLLARSILSFTMTSPGITCSAARTFALNTGASKGSRSLLGETPVSEHAASEAAASATIPADKKRDI
jgi:hypothetical protein